MAAELDATVTRRRLATLDAARPYAALGFDATPAERLAQGGDAQALLRLQRDLARDERVMTDDLARALDESGDLPLAGELVRRLMFMDKLRREIRDALEQLED